jgi:hypothetical protein
VSFAYDVTVTIDDARVFDAFLGWLRETHVPDVRAAGSCAGEIAILDTPSGAPRALACRYRFASRDAFAAYERDHAPRLRADAIAELAKHGVAFGRGAAIARTTGEIVS